MELRTFKFESIHSFDGDVTTWTTEAYTAQEAADEIFGDGPLNRANYRLVDVYEAENINFYFLGVTDA